MTNWVLIIQLNGEWEKCLFHTRKEALAAFIALAADYELDLGRALLFQAPQPAEYPRPFAAHTGNHSYIN